MQPASPSGQASRKTIWAGRAISTVVTLFMLLDAGMKILNTSPSVEGTVHLGYPQNLVFEIGILLLTCTVLYIIPWTCVLGAILLTGYLGGAVASQLRIGEPLFSHVLFPVYIGILAWGGIYVREPKLRALIPLQR
jgi:DoxX-like family